MAVPVRLINGETRPYGFGWHVLTDSPGFVLYHAGGLWSFRSHYLFSVQPDIGIIILANCRDANVGGLTSGLLQFFAPKVEATWTRTVSQYSSTYYS